MQDDFFLENWITPIILIMDYLPSILIYAFHVLIIPKDKV